MRFTKPSISVAEQIALLEQRGMTVSEREKAHHFLSHVNYYRLRAYWLPFEAEPTENGDHHFREGASLDDAIILYKFDRELRLLVLDAIERVEVSMRATWGTHLALQYGPHGYLNADLYRRQEYYSKSKSNLLSEIDRSKDTFITHYRTKYTSPTHPPVWMAAEIMSLGLLSSLFDNLKHRADQQAIAKAYNLNGRVLASIIHHLTHVRNICAHHGRLWNKRFTVTMSVPKQPATLGLAMNPEADRLLYNTLAVLGYLLTIVSPGSKWRYRLISLIESYPMVDPAVMGFPEQWRHMDFWRADSSHPT